MGMTTIGGMQRVLVRSNTSTAPDYPPTRALLRRDHAPLRGDHHGNRHLPGKDRSSTSRTAWFTGMRRVAQIDTMR